MNQKHILKLSDEFRTSYGRACDIIPFMFKRLTLIDGYSYKDAVAKIYADHKDLPGFSYRNIHRSLPIDSPIVPRRVVPPRHKNSVAKLNSTIKLSDSELSGQDNKKCNRA